MFETAILIYNVEYMYTIWAGVLIAWSIKPYYPMVIMR